MTKFIKIFTVILIIFVMTSIQINIVYSAEDIEELKKHKEELENNLTESNNQIQIMNEEMTELLIKIEEISLEIIEKNKSIDKIAIENEALNKNIKSVQRDLKKAREDYEKKKDLMEKRLVASYKMGKISYLDVLLNSKGLISFLSNYYLVDKVIKSDSKLVTECAELKENMEKLNVSLLEQSDILNANNAEIQKTKISLENMQALKNRNVEELTEAEKIIFLEIEDYQNEIASIEKEIRFLSLASNNEVYVGGDMAWPVPGYTRITSEFGMRTHPITGIYKLHTGTDIGAPYGATFIASNDGIVVKAEMNPAYGNMVIIDHGGGITTLYAHGSEILVNAGDIVSQGTPVLKVGSTGYSTGPHAHFEVRVNGEYKNPIEYLFSNKMEENQEQVVID